MNPSVPPSGPPTTRLPRTLRHGRALLVAALGLAAGGACGNNTATNPGDLLGIAGTYQLVQVNAAPLPYDKGTAFVVRGHAIIHGSPRYDLVETDSGPNANVDVTFSGVWNISNNALTLKDDNGSFYFGSLSGGQDTLRVQIESYLETFVRQ
jgi:hypothetical protein